MRSTCRWDSGSHGSTSLTIAPALDAPAAPLPPLMSYVPESASKRRRRLGARRRSGEPLQTSPEPRGATVSMASAKRRSATSSSAISASRQQSPNERQVQPSYARGVAVSLVASAAGAGRRPRTPRRRSSRRRRPARVLAATSSTFCSMSCRGSIGNCVAARMIRPFMGDRRKKGRRAAP